jgi:hypothetical protein
MGTLRTLPINLHDVLDWLRTKPETMQFDVNDPATCIFSLYLAHVYPSRDVSVGAYTVTVDANKYQLPAPVVQILDRFIWQDDDPGSKDEAAIWVSRDEAIDALEQVTSREACSA